jgi:hypothetical protein
MTESSAPNRYESYASVIAPAAAGVALGMLFGREMERKTSNIVALTLLSAAAVVAAPVVTDLIQRAANRPSTARGSRLRLQGIRNGALPVPESEEYMALDDELLATH